MIEWVVWAILLLAQNASFTLVSRARNSNSLGYHALAGLGSNGIWFAGQFILFQKMFDILKTGSWGAAAGVGLFYTVFTLIGSVGMHWIAMHKLERKKV